jgi:small subunit ribosomal protein S20
LANTKSALKEIRKNEKRRVRNRLVRGRARTYLKRAARAIDSRADDAGDEIRAAIRALDKAAAKGIIHKNNAARRKSRLMKRVRARGGES